MRTSTTLIAFTLISFVLLSCKSTKNVAGTYHTNFASLGFFGSTVRLMQDSTFQYVFQGDLIYDSAIGRYCIYDQKVFLNFDKETPDSTKLYYRFDNMPARTTIISGNTIKYQSFYYIGHKKLFATNAVTGKKITKSKRYNKRKKYILFGTHYYKKRWYLKLRE
jgi:hypothetical protein